MNIFKIVTTLIFVIISQILYSQGLLFHGNYEPISDRTTLKLFAENPVSFAEFMEISFDFSLYDTETFGYLLFVKDRNTKKEYSISLTPENNLVYMKFNITGKKCLLKIPIDKENLGIKNWQKFRLVFNKGKNEIWVYFNNRRFKVNSSLPSVYNPEIVFGKFGSYVDIPRFAIKKIHVQGSNKLLKFNLNERIGDIIFDTKGVEYGFVENPVWLINESYKWKLRYKKRYLKRTAINFDEKNQSFYILNRDSIAVFELKNNTTTIHGYQNKFPSEILLGNSFIDKANRKLVVYEMNNLPQNSVSMSALDLNSLKWEVLSKDQLPWQLHHHASFFNEKSGTYITFGGFGNQHYYNNFNSFNNTTRKWEIEQYKGDRVQPRLLTGIVKLDSTKGVIFGGIGNESGDISVGKVYYYNCFLIDFEKKNSKLLWEIKLNETGLSTVRNMILSDDKKAFYTICYPEYKTNTKLQLYKFSISNGKYEILGDSIPFMSDKIDCNANLYYSSKTQEIFCVTQEYNEDGSNTVSIYSISSPPLSEGTFGLGIKKTNTFIIIVFIILIIVISFFVAISLVKRNKKKKSFNDIHLADIKYQGDKIRANSIYAFGDFTVFDNKGKNISHLFNPKIKQVFVYIFLKSIQNDKGVDSHEIQIEIWPEKSAENAKNLKGVAINQLRKIFADIDGIELVHANGYYNIVYDEPLYFDFIQFIDLTKNIPLSMESYRAVYEITSRGVFLQGITTKELRTNFALKCIQFKEKSMSQLSVLSKSRENENIVIIASILMNMDIYNLQALDYLLQAYIRLEMKTEARSIYALYYFLWTEEFRKNHPPELTEFLSTAALSKH